MSRRHHGRPHHGGRHRGDSARPAAPAQESPRPGPSKEAAAQGQDVSATSTTPILETPIAAMSTPATPVTAPQPAVAATPAPPIPSQNGTPRASAAPRDGNGGARGQDQSNGCTAPQLRRFIKSRPYVPMHELRRRFAINGGDDDVTQVRLDESAIYVGLPAREGSLLGELLRGGEIGYELSHDPRSPIVVGVYPMRPVPRG
jgi:hypothetical protein